MNATITATFQDRNQADRALGSLRRAGALCHAPSLPREGRAGQATLHLMVRQSDAALARSILYQAGGRL